MGTTLGLSAGPNGHPHSVVAGSKDNPQKLPFGTTRQKSRTSTVNTSLPKLSGRNLRPVSVDGLSGSYDTMSGIWEGRDGCIRFAKIPSPTVLKGYDHFVYLVFSNIFPGLHYFLRSTF